MISPVKVWRRQKHIRQFLGKKGKVLSWTKIFVAGSSHKKFAPYPVVLVEFEDKTRLYGQLVDFDNSDIKIGMKVESVLRKVRQVSDDGVIAYGIKFKPL